MREGKQELKLLRKHERGCLQGSHLIPATAAPRRRFPFIQASCSLPGEFTGTKTCAGCSPWDRLFPLGSFLPRGAAAAAQQDTRGCDQLLGCCGDTVPVGSITIPSRASPRGLRGEGGKKGDFLLLGWLWGNCQLSLDRKKRSRLWGFSGCPHSMGHENSAGPILVTPFPLLFQVQLPCIPPNYESQGTLLFGQAVPGSLPAA